VRVIILLLMLCPLLAPSTGFALVGSSLPSAASNIDLLLERAMSENLIAGGVVVVGNREGILATASRGQVNSLPGAQLINDRTVFDVASLTKVIATTPAVIKLLEEGRINLTDPLSRWFPEFADTDKGQITVLHLMTHTSGLSDVSVNSEQSMQSVIRKVAAQNRRGAGTSFDYADINFILLGEMVHRVSGETLDAFCQEQIYGPLGTRETQFLPPNDLLPEIAPTSGNRGGVVQDENARRLGGVAGHAGLFSSAYDLSRYARLMLGGGLIDGKRILSEQVVAQMTTPYLCNNGHVRRGLGWDMASPFSAPKGNYFSDSSFGHTGYSGSSIWIDPEQDLFVILLTRRTNYRNVKDFNQLRRDVSTYAAADFNSLGDDVDVASSQVRTHVVLASADAVKSSLRSTKVAVVSTKLAARGSKVAARGTTNVARSSQKWLKDKRAAQCGTKSKSDKQIAKAGVRHRVSRAAKVAKSESGKFHQGSRKRRALPKS